METAILLVFQDCVPKTGCIEWGMLLVESKVSLYFFFTSTSLWQLRIALAVSHHMITHLETRGNIKVEFVKITFQINNFHRIGPLGRFDLVVAMSVCLMLFDV